MDNAAILLEQVQQAVARKSPLVIRGGSSKSWLGREVSGALLDISNHSGIVDYDPRELVLTARAGTPLHEIESILADAGQMLAFEPPHWGETATLGGTIACGLSGPRRPHAGSARDSVLGCEIINGHGEQLRFGGRVMKNVAGYDVSRLMTGACGTLGVLLEISLKVLPCPASTLTLVFECSAEQAIARMAELRTRPLPVDAVGYHTGACYVRLSGSQEAVNHAHTLLGGEVLPHPDSFWTNWREHKLHFFDAIAPLYRIVVKPATPPLAIEGDWLIDWAGAQRWLASNEPPEQIRETVAVQGGYVSLHRGGDRAQVLNRLPEAMLLLQQRIKAGFDPYGIFNRGRLYSEI